MPRAKRAVASSAVADHFARNEQDINALEAIFAATYQGYGFTPLTRINVRKMLEMIGPVECAEAMEISIGKMGTPGNALKYFFGICWRKHERKTDPTILQGKGSL